MQFLCVLPSLDGKIHPMEAYLEVVFLSVPILCVVLGILVLCSHTLVPVLIHTEPHFHLSLAILCFRRL